MDATSSFQVLVTIAASTTALVVAIRSLGKFAASGHPDPKPVPATTSAPGIPSDLDMNRLVAILSAAASEMLDADRVKILSIATADAQAHSIWPRRRRTWHRKPDRSPPS